MRSSTINLSTFRKICKKLVLENGAEDPDNTSLVIISNVLDKPKSWVLAHDEYHLSQKELQTVDSQIKKYLQGIPLPYILGEWEFYGLPFKVTPDVLIPRPETELLVELAIDYAKENNSSSLVDVGTGSGIIAITLARALPDVKVFSIDISRAAIKLAKQNAIRHQQSQIKFIQSDLLTPFQTEFDIICANLPYIPSHDLDSLQVAKWEPKIALDGGITGLSHIARLLSQAKNNLIPAGCLFLEIESSLKKQSLDIAKTSFPDANFDVIKDLAGLDRVLKIVLS